MAEETQETQDQDYQRYYGALPFPTMTITEEGPNLPPQIKWFYLDKRPWGEGPWVSEPDKMQWRDQETGLPCLIVRSHFGNLCGYVGIYPSHPLYGVGYGEKSPCLEEALEKLKQRTDIGLRDLGTMAMLSALLGDFGPRPDNVIEVHGGITFAGPCAAHDGEENPERGICHLPAPGEEPVWWYGFDCGHSQDIQPGMESYYRNKHPTLAMSSFMEQVYRDLDYVRDQCAKMAKQLKDLDTALKALPAPAEDAEANPESKLSLNRDVRRNYSY